MPVFFVTRIGVTLLIAALNFNEFSANHNFR